MKRLSQDCAPLSETLPDASASLLARVVSVDGGTVADGPRRTATGVLGLVVGVEAVGVPLLPGWRAPARDGGAVAPGALLDDG